VQQIIPQHKIGIKDCSAAFNIFLCSWQWCATQEHT